MAVATETIDTLTLSDGLQILPVPHPAGCRSYLLLEPEKLEAAAVDVHLDSVREIAAYLIGGGWDLKAILDTHTHADFPSGAKALNEWFGTTRMAHPAAKHRGVDHTPRDGEVLGLGGKEVTIRYAPGHTPDHMVLVTSDALFSGDSLFIGGVARTDFLGGDAGELYDTLHKLLAHMSDDTWLFPGHDYHERLHSRIGQERRENPWLLLEDRDEFITRLKEGKPPEPANMQALLRLNREGVEIPARVTAAAVIETVKAGGGGSVIDVRTAVEASLERIPDSVNIPAEAIEARADDVRRVPAPRVLVCNTSRRSKQAQATLDSIGVQGVSVLDGGITAYKEADGPIDTPGKRLSVARQASLVVGTLVAAGAALGAWVATGFLWLVGIIALDRMIAGTTGRGVVEWALEKMPWNRGRATAESEAAALAHACAAELVPACAADDPTD